MAAEGDNFEPGLLQAVADIDFGLHSSHHSSSSHSPGGHSGHSGGGNANERGHGHFFSKKTFGKPTYCHHCTELLWGILSQGYVCEVCNFTCHEKCLKTVASYCSGVAMQLIKNPVAHCWSEPGPVKRRFCNVCRKRTDDSITVECEVCEYYVHLDCQDLAVSDCKEATTYVPSLEPTAHVQHHHWREGNLPQSSKCCVCKKSCWSAECLAGMRCEWCGATAHATCYRQATVECDFGALRKIMLPPNCLTIPRAELPMEQLLSIRIRDRESMSPYKVAPDDASLTITGTTDEPGKEKEDYETIKMYDGTVSLQRGMYRLCTIPKAAACQQIVIAALRTFHIQDNSHNYYVTQVVNEEASEEVLLDDPQPLKSFKRDLVASSSAQTSTSSKQRPQLFLRYKDIDPHRTSLIIYGGWLRIPVLFRIPVCFCNVTVNEDTTVEAVIAEALTKFGLTFCDFSTYNLVEVSLDRGVVERTLENDEKMLQLVRTLRNCSLKRFQLTRFYLQEKEDPHGSTVAVFVGNLPPSLAQRQYERILLRLLGADEKPFTAIGPIYYEYGSLVITFNSPKAATKACLKLQKANYEKRLLVLCLPNIQPHMIPRDVEPLMVLVNVKSGGCQGLDLIRSFRKLLNPFQVFDILNGGPLVGLYVFRNIPKYRILVCGGDGTVGWVLQCLDIVGQDSVCSSPPCGVVPLGTGNDLARVLRWGGGYTGQEDPLQILKDVIDAEEVRLDRWTLVFHAQEPSELPSSSSEHNPDTALQMNNPEDQTSMIIMNNYFGIGIDADVCLAFHRAREENPEKFNSRMHNKRKYLEIGLKKFLNQKLCKDLHTKIRLEVDSKPIELPPIEGLIVLNIPSWASGANPWGPEKEESGFSKPTHYDGLLELIGVTGIVHLGQIQTGISVGIRIAQGGHIKIVTTTELPVQTDGEPQMQPPGTVTILKSALKATMLKKSKSKRRNTDPLVPRASAGSTSSAGGAYTHTSSIPQKEPLSAGMVPLSPHPINYLLQEPEDEFL